MFSGSPSAAAPIRLLFVCTGNTCRSPMAEAIARRNAADGAVRAISESAGVAASTGSPASPESIAVMREAGIDIAAHRSRIVTAGILRNADLVLALAQNHADAIRERFPRARAKTRLLGSFLKGRYAEAPDISDPFGGSLRDYREAREIISEAIAGLWAHLPRLTQGNR